MLILPLRQARLSQQRGTRLLFVRRANAASAPVQAAARVAMVNNAPVVQFDDNFDRAWRRVGLTLDRTGFTVEDRDRSQGLYYVRYVEPRAPDRKEPGFFGKLFSFGSSSTKEPAPIKYRVAVALELAGLEAEARFVRDRQPDHVGALGGRAMRTRKA